MEKSIASDVAFLLKIARYGKRNPLHDTARLLEIAYALSQLAEGYDDALRAATACAGFITEHADALAPIMDSNPTGARLLLDTLYLVFERAKRDAVTFETSATLDAEQPRLTDATVIDAKKRATEASDA